MNLSVKIGYEEIFELVRQLPEQDIKKLNLSIKRELINKPQKNNKEKLQELILNAPIWNDDDYSNYLAVREQINQSRLS